MAALAAAVADLLGVNDEACAAPEIVVVAPAAEPAQVGAGQRTCPFAGPGSAWAAAGRRDLIAGRAGPRRY